MNNLKNGFASASFIKVSVAAALVLAVMAGAAGYFLPKGSVFVQHGLRTLRKHDREYVGARTKFSGENIKTESLTRELEEKKAELDDFVKSQDNLDKITESNAALENERDALKKEVEEKRADLDRLNAAAKAYASKIMTWTSGDYTVGTDAAAGKYMITGTGSIAIANKGKAKVNKLLKADGEVFTFSDGDLIHIDGSAKITPQ